MNKLIKNLIIISSIITTSYLVKKIFIDDEQENKINNLNSIDEIEKNEGHPLCRITEEELKDVWGPCNDI